MLLLLGIYSIFLLAICGRIIPQFDSFYYWDWSRHLALSYYDGPPLIAYMMWLYTKIFGNNLFALNMLSISSVLMTGYLIYRSMLLITERQCALLAAILWIILPMTSQYLIRKSTYDNPFAIFWALSLYFTIRYMLTHKNHWLYAIGASIGLLLLSKYTGIILVLSLILFTAITPQFRKLYKNPHFYLSLIVGLIIVSPVIIWNAQRHWVSILFQLHDHSKHLLSIDQRLKQVGLTFLQEMLPAFGLGIVFLMIGSIKSGKALYQQPVWRLLLTLSVMVIIFYTIAALFVQEHPGWFMPFFISGSMLMAYFITTFHWRRTLITVIIIYLLGSAVILLANSVFSEKYVVEGARYKLMQEFSKQYAHNTLPLVTSSWISARLIFGIASKPPIYTFPCDPQNEYKYWSKGMQQAVAKGRVKQVLYIDNNNHRACIERYFSHCQQQPTLRYHHQKLFIYRCSTSIKTAS